MKAPAAMEGSSPGSCHGPRGRSPERQPEGRTEGRKAEPRGGRREVPAHSTGAGLLREGCEAGGHVPRRPAQQRCPKKLTERSCRGQSGGAWG